MKDLLNTPEMVDEALVETTAEAACAADKKQGEKLYSLTVLLNIYDKVRTACGQPSAAKIQMDTKARKADKDKAAAKKRARRRSRRCR